jgi:uncharacterized surface protein with fasciclin (FAS1) repeats
MELTRTNIPATTPNTRTNTRPTPSLCRLGSLAAGTALAAFFATGALLAAPSATAHAQTTPAAMAATRDIVDTAAAAGQFTTLARALTAAGLVDTLKGPGPFTVFAPTDAAFAKVPADQLNALLADPAQLRAVLTYHVAAGSVPASQVLDLASAKTVQGEPVAIGVRGDAVYLNGTTRVAQTDVQASNGLIHVIDTVLLPPSIAPRTVARDGQSLDSQAPGVQTLFRGTWGDRAAARWVEEHEVALS